MRTKCMVALLYLLASCAPVHRQAVWRIENVDQDMIVRMYASENQRLPRDARLAGQAAGQIPVEGIPAPIELRGESVGIYDSVRVEIGRVGGRLIFEQALCRNQGINLRAAIEAAENLPFLSDLSVSEATIYAGTG